jgi:hypothetical protein
VVSAARSCLISRDQRNQPQRPGLQPTRIAEKLRVPIQQLLGIISARFSKPKTKFLGPMIFGVSASQDCKLSQVARVLGEPILLKKTETRRLRHLATASGGRHVNRGRSD